MTNPELAFYGLTYNPETERYHLGSCDRITVRYDHASRRAESAFYVATDGKTFARCSTAADAFRAVGDAVERVAGHVCDDDDSFDKGFRYHRRGCPDWPKTLATRLNDIERGELSTMALTLGELSALDQLGAATFSVIDGEVRFRITEFGLGVCEGVSSSLPENVA